MFLSPLLLAGALCAAPLHVHLPEAVTVAGRQPTLGEVAELHSAAAGLAAAAARLPLGSLPPGAASLTLERRELARLLQGRWPACAPVWSGAMRVRVQAASQPLPGALALSTAAQQLQGVLAAAGLRAEVQALQAPPQIELPGGDIRLVARPLTLEQALRSRVSVVLDVLLDGAFLRALQLPFAVRAMGEAPHSARAWQPGQVLACDAVALQETDLAALAGPPAPPCVADGQRLRRSVAAGQVLLAADLEAVPAVQQGQSVRLQVRAGAVQLEARGTALTDAAVGERVAVRLAGGSAVQATVIGPRLVKIEGK
ncbi:MAG: flgA [Pseudoduganella sp.]|jgi:flagella basal body P-ring formation protein FlgA|nr:flgA [Pseudoduganella sp.]